MKKLSLFLAFFMIGSFGAAQGAERQKGPELDGKGYLAIAVVTAAYALGVRIVTGEVDSVDVKNSLSTAIISTYGVYFFKDGDKKTGAACVVLANAMMFAYICAKIGSRPVPVPIPVPRRLIMEVEEVYDLRKVKKEEESFA
jgi:hypothetical protein